MKGESYTAILWHNFSDMRYKTQIRTSMHNCCVSFEVRKSLLKSTIENTGNLKKIKAALKGWYNK